MLATELKYKVSIMTSLNKYNWIRVLNFLIILLFKYFIKMLSEDTKSIYIIKM